MSISTQGLEIIIAVVFLLSAAPRCVIPLSIDKPNSCCVSERSSVDHGVHITIWLNTVIILWNPSESTLLTRAPAWKQFGNSCKIHSLKRRRECGSRWWLTTFGIHAWKREAARYLVVRTKKIRRNDGQIVIILGGYRNTRSDCVEV